MQVGPAVTVRMAAVEQYKNEILQLMPPHTKTSRSQEEFDEVNMSDFGRLLSALSTRGNDAAAALIENIVSGKPDESLNYFLLAYCAALGYDFSQELVLYDRWGRPEYSEEYKTLKRFLATFSDYLNDIPNEDEPAAGFRKKLKKALKKLKQLFLEDGEGKPEEK